MHRHCIHFLAPLPLLLLSFSVAFDFPECIRYEFHDQIANRTTQTQAMVEDCSSHNGYIDKLTVANITSRSSWINTTFECCGEICLFPCFSTNDSCFNLFPFYQSMKTAPTTSTALLIFSARGMRADALSQVANFLMTRTFS